MIAGILTGNLEIEDNLQILKSLGYDGLQFDFNDLQINMLNKNFVLDEGTHQAFQNFKDKINNIGLPILAFHTFYPLGESSEIVFENFKKYSEYMKEVNCKYLILHISAYSENKEYFEKAIITLKQIKYHFLQNDLLLLLENDHPPSLFVNLDDITRVNDKLHLDLCLDVSHALQSNLDLNTFFYTLKTKIKVIHLSDYSGGKAHLSIGEGVIESQNCFRDILLSDNLKVLEVSRSLVNSKDRDEIIKVYSDSLNKIRDY